MTILAITNWHNRPELLFDQIQNYNLSFDSNIIHLVNINSNFSVPFWKAAKNLSIDFNIFENVLFVDPPVKTHYFGIVHAFHHCVLAALRLKLKFEYFYFHTSSDLMLKRDAHRHIQQFDIGFGKSSGSPIEYVETEHGERVTLPLAKPTPQLHSIGLDPKTANVLRGIGLPVLHKSRAEGCFFRRELFFEIMNPLLSNMSIRDMETLSPPYPIEEYLWSQCVEFYCSRNSVKRTRHLVTTSKQEKSIASTEEMDAVLASPDLFGIKRFPQQLDAPERQYVRKLLGLALHSETHPYRESKVQGRSATQPSPAPSLA